MIVFAPPIVKFRDFLTRYWRRMEGMEPYQIILLVVILLLFLYISVFLLVLSNALTFRKKLRQRGGALIILCLEKQDVMLAWAALFGKEGYKFSKEDEELISSLSSLDLKKPNKKDWDNMLLVLKQANRRLSFLAEEVDWGDSQSDKDSYVSTLHDLDANYRQSLAIYNADVGAYNYWVSIPGVSWILYLFGLRKKRSLN